MTEEEIIHVMTCCGASLENGVRGDPWVIIPCYGTSLAHGCPDSKPTKVDHTGKPFGHAFWPWPSGPKSAEEAK